MPGRKVYGGRLGGVPGFNFSFEGTEPVVVNQRYTNSNGNGNGNGKGLLRATSCNNSMTTINALSKVEKHAHHGSNNLSNGNVNSTSYLNSDELNESGYLRRSVTGQSNQSLCSCDAGAETEFQNDPLRPLYQYNLEKTTNSAIKRHTYTCEQNAQILRRLERERAVTKRDDKKTDSEVNH